MGVKDSGAKPDPPATTEKDKECNPGGSPMKKVSEPELKISQGEIQALSWSVSTSLSTLTRRLVLAVADSNGPIDVLTLLVWENVNGKVTLVGLELNKFAEPDARAMAVETPRPGPAKPDTTAVTLPGVEANAVLVARALPECSLDVNVVPGKKEILVPNGIGSLTNDSWTKSL